MTTIQNKIRDYFQRKVKISTFEKPVWGLDVVFTRSNRDFQILE
ncbi:hypothetical protein LEP1GSC193_0912 [Leptospira alstonii serovar Pingchang str. 80-412]|uniref:Uncharacterized protein n=2 Tax=Leptospira alstonii TaxID=28452 RepID=M6CTX2_9LEPT|nr:hypothetical protein LEP1GSC194_3691 [Leptospira alstonii serovar Sichuan str. 79601]EQA80130.1 hypothetical protein LEP1GSC193_0912 [Leptospira alstonii serovar Pingchang str. 80-412]